MELYLNAEMVRETYTDFVVGLGDKWGWTYKQKNGYIWKVEENEQSKKNFKEVLCKADYGLLAGVLYAFWHANSDCTGLAD